MKKNIIIVEDDPLLSDIYLTKLEKKGYNLESVNKGEDALRVLKKKKFDLLLLDINLPDINGWDLLVKIRKIIKNRKIKTIILSNFDNEDKEKTEKMKVEEYIVKVYHTPEEVVKKIQKYL